MSACEKKQILDLTPAIPSFKNPGKFLNSYILKPFFSALQTLEFTLRPRKTPRFRHWSEKRVQSDRSAGTICSLYKYEELYTL